MEITPQFLDIKSYVGKKDRQHWRDILTEGIVETNDLKVQEKSTPDMSVDVLIGKAYVQGDQSATQGHYRIYNDATVNKTIAASDPTNPRKDRVIAQVKDSTDIGGADDEWEIQVLTGTPAASPVVPALPDDALDLAIVDVGNGVTEITNANITDQRTQIGTQNLDVVVDKVAGILGTDLAKNSIIFGPAAFNLDNPNPPERVEADGTSTKSKQDCLSWAKGEYADLKPDFPVPERYDGGIVIVRYAYRCLAANKTHRMRLQVASIGSSGAFNPNLGTAFDITAANQTSDGTIGDLLIASASIAQASIGWVAGENIQMRVFRHATEGDADAVLIPWIEFKWNKS